MRKVDPGTLNLAWACRILAALREWGIAEVGIAPGSRSGPLVLAAAKIGGISPRVHLDERSAGFFALGYGRARGRPAAVITTSGTAVANLLPAVVEADLSDLPLVLLTADRPPRLRGADANQTIEQPGIFGGRVRFEADLPVPSRALLDSAGTDSPFSLATRAMAAALGPPAGPAHLNVPFDKPLEPASPERVRIAVAGMDGRRGIGGSGGNALGLRSGGAAVAPSPEKPSALPSAREREAQVADVAACLARAERPLLVAGPARDPDGTGPAAVRFAAAHGVPLLADPLSGARFLPVTDPPAPVLGGYDHFLRADGAIARCTPDLVIRIGRTPTSAALEGALERWRGAFQVVIDDGSRPKDHQRLANLYLQTPVADLLGRLAAVAPPTRTPGEDREEPGDPRPSRTRPPDPRGPRPHHPTRLPWLRQWRELEAATWSAIDPATLPRGHEGAYAAALLDALPPGSALFASSSMPVRDVDAYGRPANRGVAVFANRGASGIDGVVSSALGCAAGRGGPVAALIGDIAFYHDMNGLLAARDRSLNVVFVVIDNDGGGIFHMLPIRNFEPAFTPYFATPHGLDFSHAARLHGLPFADADTPRALGEAVAAAVTRPGAEVVRVRTRREENRRLHEEVRRRVIDRIQSRILQSQAAP